MISVRATLLRWQRSEVRHVRVLLLAVIAAQTYVLGTVKG